MDKRKVEARVEEIEEERKKAKNRGRYQSASFFAGMIRGLQEVYRRLEEEE